jgi:branched-chain amino acid transport system ATP-binding protein
LPSRPIPRRVGFRVDIRNKLGTRLRDLSHGEQRQVEVLLAASTNPKILLLDEPTAGLARADVPLMTDTVKELCSSATLILIEHDMSVLFGLTDYVTVLHHGGVVADGPLDEVRENARVQEVYLGGAV